MLYLLLVPRITVAFVLTVGLYLILVLSNDMVLVSVVPVITG